jgi:cell division protein FtsZ
MGIGRAAGENRAAEAAKAAIDSPLLELSIQGAKGVLFTIAGGANLSMYEVNEAAEVITASVDPNAKGIFGAIIDETLNDEVKVTVIATGFAQTKEREPRTEKFQVTPPKILQTPKNFFSKKDMVHANPQMIDSQPSVRPLPPVDNNLAKTKEEEDLEIPTFIRKKINL